MNKIDLVTWFQEVHQQVTTEIIHQKTDRGFVLCFAILVEIELTDLLKNCLLPTQEKPGEDPLFGRGRPIEYFAPKIDLAYRIGLNSEKLTKDLKYIKKIRNDVAHERDIYLLNQDTVRNLSEKFVNHMPDMRKAIPLDGPKGDFFLAVEMVLYELHTKKKYIELQSIELQSGYTVNKMKAREKEYIYDPKFLKNWNDHFKKKHS